MSSRKRFENKHALITGGARGIGFEIARQFGEEGAILTLFDNNEANLTQAKQDLESMGYQVQTFVVDISNQPAVQLAVVQSDNFQPIDILINNAGVASETPFLEITAADWQKIIDVNLTGMFFVSQAVCQKMAMRKSGVVVNMGSKNGIDGEFGYAHYNASKGGVIMLTKTMALELAHFNIRANAVCPGYIQTPMAVEIDPPGFAEAFADRFIPLNRVGKVEEIAPLFLFLASDESSFMTGQIMVADGGQLAGQKAGKDLIGNCN